MTYSEKLKDPAWHRKRSEILDRDNHTCKNCGGNESNQDNIILHVHHIAYGFEREPWYYDNSFLITLCSICHKDVTNIKKELKLDIDTKFILPDHLIQLKDIIGVLKNCTPDQLFHVYNYMMFLKLG